MLALRSIARCTPRTVARLSTKATRPQPFLFNASRIQSSWAQFRPQLSASFHVSAVNRQIADVGEELAAKLQSEITYEESERDDEELSSNIREYIESSPFEIEDKPGIQEVTLTRTYENETIRVTFSTSDTNAQEPNEELNDTAMYDGDIEDLNIEGQSGGANTKGAINQGKAQDGNVRVAPEDRLAPADREELDDDFASGSEELAFSCRANIRIERPGKGALAIEAIAQDGDFLIEELYYYPSADLAEPETAEKNWQSRNLYTGPPFNNLDEDLQILLEKYLEERGVNTRMALFIPDYVDHKEQREYIGWLKNIKSFVE